MSSIRLIHITPELPPTVGGIADYTGILSQRLVEVSDGAVEPVLVRAGKASGTPPEVDFRCVDHGGTYSAKTLCATIEQLANEAGGPAVVLLQYSGYGYAPRGAPLWLLRALQQACGEGGVPLITMFHEVRARDWRPWTSAFWLSPVQRYVAARLARLSARVVTNRVASAQWLRRYARYGQSVKVQPVFSNIGEPSSVTLLKDRKAYAVVFGGRGMKKRLYQTMDARLINALQCHGMERIVDIGASDRSANSVKGCCIEYRGIQPAPVISNCLQQARFGLLHYPATCLTKSGIWGSYAVHGTPALIFSDSRPTYKIKENKHYLRVRACTEPCFETSLQRVGRSAKEWYSKVAHSQKAAETFLALTKSIAAL